MNAPARRQRCSAHSSQSGHPCKRWAIRGGTVCATHGGRAPQVQRSARERLAALLDPVLAGLELAVREASKSKDPHALDRLARTVLDRCGLPAAREVKLEDVTPPAPEPWMKWATVEELRAIRELVQAARDRMEQALAVDPAALPPWPPPSRARALDTANRPRLLVAAQEE